MKNIKPVVFIFSLFVIGILFFLDRNSVSFKNLLSQHIVKTVNAQKSEGGGGTGNASTQPTDRGSLGNSTSPPANEPTDRGPSAGTTPSSGNLCDPKQDDINPKTQTVSGTIANSYHDTSIAPSCTGFNNDATISLTKYTDTCTGSYTYTCSPLDKGTNPSTAQPNPPQQTTNPGSTSPTNGSGTTPNTTVTQTQAQQNKTNANSTEAQFTNICGSGPVACSSASSCNSLYDNNLCPASCNPDQKSCDGQGKNYVYKYVCDGKVTNCGGSSGAKLITKTTSSVNATEGVTCGKTVSLDVYDKQCDTSGSWSCNADDLKGYFDWYSGDCSTTQPPTVGSSASPINNATSSEPQYTNICGSSYQACSTASSCNSAYDASQCSASCNPDTQSCDGQGKNYVYKFICNGKSNECGNGVSSPIVAPIVSQGQQNISTGLTCGQTSQLDVFDKNCTANGPWDCSKPLGYMVYYSGDCNQPTATPSATLTPGPACGQTCSASTPCPQSATNSCTACVNGTCQAPTPTPTPTGPACGSACTTPADCTQSPTNSCTACVNGTCQAPTPTPTPSFNPAACKCAGTTISSIVPGGQVTVNSTYQVLGADQSTAKVNSVSFYLVKGDNTTGDPVKNSDPIPATIGSINSSGGTQYNANWNFTMPADVDPNAVYRVFTQDDCQAQTGTSPQTNAQNVQVASVQNSNQTPSTQKQNFFSSIFDFFRSLIGLRDTTTNTVTPTPTQTGTPTPTTGKSKQNLQLGTLPVAKMLPQTACTVIRFQFPQPAGQ